MKYILIIKKFLGWLLYWFLTQNERHLYQMGKIKGMQCIKTEDESILLPRSTVTYYYNPNQEPTRTYLTWKEYWSN